MTLAMCTVRLRSQSSRSRRIGRCVFSLIRIGQRQCRAVDEKCVGRAPSSASVPVRVRALARPWALRAGRSALETTLDSRRSSRRGRRAGPERCRNILRTGQKSIRALGPPPHPARVVPPPRQPATTEPRARHEKKPWTPDIWPNSGGQVLYPVYGGSGIRQPQTACERFPQIAACNSNCKQMLGGVGRRPSVPCVPAVRGSPQAPSADPESSTSRAFARGVRGGFGDAVRLAPRGRPEGRSAERHYPDTGLRRGHACHPHAA